MILPAHAGGRVLTTSDVVTIRVLNEPELTTTKRVEPDGTVNFAYVGRIKAAGLTEDELELLVVLNAAGEELADRNGRHALAVQDFVDLLYSHRETSLRGVRHGPQVRDCLVVPGAVGALVSPLALFEGTVRVC